MIGQKVYYSTGVEFPGVGLANDAVYGIEIAGGPGPTTLHQIGGFSPSTNTDYFVMLFDNDASAVIAGDTPFQCFAVPSGASFSWEPSLSGHDCLVGLAYAISTTSGVYTASAGASLFLYAQYIPQYA